MKRNLLFLLLAFLAVTPSRAQTYATRVVKDKLFIPWEIIYGPDDHIWMTQKNGYICRLDPASGVLDTLWHQSDNIIKNEGGMLGMALHPDFATSPYVYVAYEYNKGSVYTERVMRYTYSGGVLTAPTILLDDIVGGNIHNGSRLLIVDHKLYISTGDAGNTAAPQNLALVNGKVLRINLDGTIPADNPVPGSPVWNWGQRNIQGMVYANSMLYSSMHGATADDEINILLQGRNYGWPNVEGYCNTSAEMSFCTDSNVVEPIQTWTPTIAPAGIDYYNHTMFPDLRGSLLMTTLKDESLYQLKLNGTFDSVVSINIIDSLSSRFGRLRDICIAPNGSIFVSTSNSNAAGTGAFTDRIIELYDPTATAVPLTEQPAKDPLVLYPNPAATYMDVASNNGYGQRCDWTITDITGLIAFDGSGTFPFRVDISRLPPGMYVFSYFDEDSRLLRHKFMKQ